MHDDFHAIYCDRKRKEKRKKERSMLLYLLIKKIIANYGDSYWLICYGIYHRPLYCSAGSKCA
jgi:hypothetical protein